MQFTVTIECDNDAFSDDPADEIVRLLEDIVESLQAGKTEGRLIDYYGNTVGKFELSGEPEEEDEDADNEAQGEAENIAMNVEPLYLLGQEGDEIGLEAAFREHIAGDRFCTIDPDNVDYGALAAFLQE